MDLPADLIEISVWPDTPAGDIPLLVFQTSQPVVDGMVLNLSAAHATVVRAGPVLLGERGMVQQVFVPRAV